MRSGSGGRYALALGAWGVALGWALLLDDPRLRFPSFAVALGVAQVSAWLAGAAAKPESGSTERAVFALGLAARTWALLSAPAFSDDVFRYRYEGRVVWFTDLGFPFRVAPAEAPEAGIPPALLDESWRRINHPEVPTIYPPLAQLFFVGAGGVALATGASALLVLKGSFVAVEALTVRALVRRASDRRPLLYGWWLCPAFIWETAREGHVDGLSACALALGIAAFGANRPQLGHVAWAAAALVKLNGLVALVASVRRTPRTMGPAVGVALLLLVPFAMAGPDAVEGLGAYATRWRSGDGVFSILASATEWMLGGRWARWGPWTLTRDGVARVAAAALWGVVVWLRARRRAVRKGLDEVAPDAGFMLWALLLLSPTLHPWYVLWLVPFAAHSGGTDRPWALRALILTAPLLHHAAWLELGDGVWRDQVEVRAFVHGTAWFALVAESLAARRATDR